MKHLKNYQEYLNEVNRPGKPYHGSKILGHLVIDHIVYL